jgi:hypothetical protein
MGREIALLAFFNKGPYEEVNVFKLKGERITDFWFADVTDTVTTKPEIIKYLRGFRYRKLRTGGC